MMMVPGTAFTRVTSVRFASNSCFCVAPINVRKSSSLQWFPDSLAESTAPHQLAVDEFHRHCNANFGAFPTLCGSLGIRGYFT